MLEKWFYRLVVLYWHKRLRRVKSYEDLSHVLKNLSGSKIKLCFEWNNQNREEGVYYKLSESEQYLIKRRWEDNVIVGIYNIVQNKWECTECFGL